MIIDYSDYITEKAGKGLVNYLIIDNGLPLFTHDSICPFCKKKIGNIVYSKNKTDYPEWLWGSFDQIESVVQCHICGWWEYKYSNRSDAILDGIRASDVEYSSSIIKKYEDSAINVPIETLRKYISKKPDIVHNINAHKMEELVRSVFSDFYPSCTVKSFGKTRDGGKDGLLIDDSGNQFLIQVKRRTKSGSTEGVEALRALIGTTVVEDNVKGCIFVSTADHFSKPAKDYARQTIDKCVVESFDLFDCKAFLKMTDVAKDKMPNAWEKLLTL